MNLEKNSNRNGKRKENQKWRIYIVIAIAYIVFLLYYTNAMYKVGNFCSNFVLPNRKIIEKMAPYYNDNEGASIIELTKLARDLELVDEKILNKLQLLSTSIEVGMTKDNEYNIDGNLLYNFAKDENIKGYYNVNHNFIYIIPDEYYDHIVLHEIGHFADSNTMENGTMLSSTKDYMSIASLPSTLDIVRYKYAWGNNRSNEGLLNNEAYYAESFAILYQLYTLNELNDNEITNYFDTIMGEYYE